MRSRIWNYAKQIAKNEEEARMDNEKSLAILWETMRNGAVDLHMHSNVSDGKTSPAQLVQELIQHKIKSFSLTDHDTIAGIEIISLVYDKLGQLGYDLPDLIPGVEISAELDGQEVHILAYYPAGGIRGIESFLEERKKDRENRNRQLCEKVKEQGMAIEYDELKHEGGYIIGRLHMAQLMIRKAFVASVDEAFDLYLAEGRPCYVKRVLPTALDTFDVIRNSGGVPVLAHPAIYKDWLRGEERISQEKLLEKLRTLKELGLQGVEVIHGESSMDESRILAEVSSVLGLLPTVGSDYHGSHKPNVHMRRGKDEYRPFLAEFFEEFRD